MYHQTHKQNVNFCLVHVEIGVECKTLTKFVIQRSVQISPSVMLPLFF